MHCTPVFTGSYDINQIRCTSTTSVLAAPLKAARHMGDVPDFGLHAPFRMPQVVARMQAQPRSVVAELSEAHGHSGEAA
jgi:hypothetical protein